MYKQLINLRQTKEERQSKYWLARSLGANSYHASRMRDWRLSKIERRFGLEPNGDVEGFLKGEAGLQSKFG